jgi:hypothetical protein
MSDELMAKVMETVTTRGRADRKADAEFATDAELWAIGNGILPEHFQGTLDQQRADVHAPDDADWIDDWCEQLRTAYDKGRLTQRIDLDALAAELNRRGVEAEVQRDCGGAYLLNVGRWYADIADGFPRRAVSVGAGYVYDRGHDDDRGVFARYDDDFGIGTSDPEVDDPEVADLEDRPYRIAELADLVIVTLHREMARREAWQAHDAALLKRMEDAVQQCELAFWERFKQLFPEITSGDVDPGMDLATGQAMAAAIRSMVDGNQPRGPWAAVPLATDAGECGRCGADDKTRCDCVAHLCDAECGDDSHPRDGRTVYLKPTPEQQSYAAELVERAAQRD